MTSSELLERLVALSRGFGTWIAPKPNRLVFVLQDVLHKVTMTHARAQPRLSLQGFLLRE